MSVAQYTFTHNQYTERHETNNTLNSTKEQYKNIGLVRAVPQLGELYPGIRNTTEQKARKNLSQGSRTIRIRKPNNMQFL